MENVLFFSLYSHVYFAVFFTLTLLLQIQLSTSTPESEICRLSCLNYLKFF